MTIPYVKVKLALKVIKVIKALGIKATKALGIKATKANHLGVGLALKTVAEILLA